MPFISVFLASLVLFSQISIAEVTTLVDSSKETLLEIDSGSLSQQAALRKGELYTEIRLKGFDYRTDAGAPEIPYLRLRVLVPPGVDLQYSVQTTNEPKKYNLKNQISFAEKLPIHNVDLFAEKNSFAYQRVYGKSAVEIEEIGFAASDRIAFLKIWPVEYNPIENSLLLRPKFKVHVRFVPTQSLERAPITDSRGSVARYIVVNPKQASRSESNSKIDLLIAHSSYKFDLVRWIEFKLARGRQVREYYVEGKTAAEVKKIIQSEYESAIPPSGTILVGNMEQIPAYRGSGDNSWTDFNYSLLGKDSIPDIALGRIPASNSEELKNFIDKDIARELEPRNVQQVLLTAGRDTSLGCPASVTKVGERMKAQSPDLEIIKKYRTQVSTADVISAYNTSPNLIVYDGHGDRRGMQEIPLTLSSLNQLSNTGFPIVFDIACLNANWSSSAKLINFTTGILFQAGHGAAGIMSSGGSGYGHDFFQDIGEILGKARKNLAEDQKMNEVAQVILAAKIINGEEDRSYWNYYGDPASSIWEASN